jgi:hypothetical protein
VRIVEALEDVMERRDVAARNELEKAAIEILRKSVLASDETAFTEVTSLELRGRVEFSRAGEEIEAIVRERTLAPKARDRLIANIVARAFPEARGSVETYGREHPVTSQTNATAWTQGLLRSLGLDAKRVHNAARAKGDMRKPRRARRK